ncbi:carcinoembryonic antigen-related cell adhesion molecule 1-like [Dreissena polymorpha]|uniref:carcinoembryonic antigen-related cell adhesion molecule 1-like n=1 Tax=Dreissena polymorpha TaxID=45954 RepID=UPI002264F87C|nr:carcinoembryonic antigen-related cell adhesion molecule 1-like [Dreissena polymorpha]
MHNTTCFADCFPACTYTWTQSEEEIGSKTYGVLSLGTLQRHETGIYICIAKNPRSAVTANSQTVAVKIRYGPDSLTMSPSSISYTMIEGESMNNIICSATCYPEQCTFIWTKSGVETSISNTGVLSLGSLQRRDAGIYTCTVRNPGSNATASSQGIEVLVRYCNASANQQSLSQVGPIVGGVVPGILLVCLIGILVF